MAIIEAFFEFWVLMEMRLAQLPCDDLFKEGKDCGPKVHKGVAKRKNNTFLKNPTNEQFSIPKISSSQKVRVFESSLGEPRVVGRLVGQDKKLRVLFSQLSGKKID